jgi:hypothetical protein
MLTFYRVMFFGSTNVTQTSYSPDARFTIKLIESVVVSISLAQAV